MPFIQYPALYISLKGEIVMTETERKCFSGFRSFTQREQKIVSYSRGHNGGVGSEKAKFEPMHGSVNTAAFKIFHIVFVRFTRF